MTKFQALFVKYLRIRREGTWRYVSAMWHNRYDFGIPFNENCGLICNQLNGINLCDEAMNVLNEKIEDGWN